MNKTGYTRDPRYAKVLEQMDLLGITDVSTFRQAKNGTIVWRLPIKNHWGGSFIEVGSFKSGMVRNQNSAYSNYQLNKCRPRTEYFKDYKWNKDFTKQTFTGKYNKFICKERILIPIEIDRLEYLISYCLKNYYIKNANRVPNGDFVPKWELERARQRKEEIRDHFLSQEVHNKAYNNGYANGLEKAQDDCEAKILILEEELKQAKDKYKKLDDFYESSKVFNDSMYEGRNDRVKELEAELEKEKETYDMLAKDYDIMRRSAQKSGALNNLSVIVNGQKYKVI